ncbi:MAG TPA: peptidoglycan recognition family protein [Verrucomicrobiae bacterium]|nr:peptidoglycan recognition family protein [Verrucomicrobiae bacterium]
MRLTFKRCVKEASLFAAVLATVSLPLSGVASAANQNTQQDFAVASTEFGVPQEILMAVSYNQTRWENHKGRPSASGGYGLMHLTSEAESEDGRGDPHRPRQNRHSSRKHTLDEAAAQLQVSVETLKHDDRQNIRGGAAILAKYGRETNDGQEPTHVDEWYGAVAKIADSPDQESAEDFANDVYNTVQNGAARHTEDGQSVSMPGRPVRPNRSRVERLRLPRSGRHTNQQQNQTECPRTIICKFVPARFAQNNPNDPVDYGNYDQAHRPNDMKVKYIVIHDTEGSYQSAIDWFRDPASYVAAHYVIRSSDGEVTQMVKNEDVAWHAGNWYVNMHSIGVEHEGIATEGAAWYTEAMYRSSAKLVRYLAEKYNVPLDREHIVGHSQYHAPTPERVAGAHWDPGPFWDWNHYMELLGTHTSAAPGSSDVVTIAPNFTTNKPPITTCTGTTCTPLPSQSANFVYLRKEPSPTADLLTDAGLHPDGTAGTTKAEDWSAKATHGQHFAVAGRSGDWTAIWFNGQKGWFYNPSGPSKTALPGRSKLVKAKNGASSVPVYGRPLPEPGAYNTTHAPVQTIVPLQYTIPAGQSYVVYEPKVPNDYFHVLAFDRSTPGDGTITMGTEKYLPITYGHRQAYVKASDVVMY